MSKKAVFLDKDGTLIENLPYNINPEKIRLMPGTLTGLKLLVELGYQLFVVTNQAGIAFGRFPETAIPPLAIHLRDLLAQARIPLKDFYYCPHHPEGIIPTYAVTCNCRKPHPGMILRAAHDYELDLKNSWVIGDILHDIEAGRKAGCHTILLDNGHETEWQLSLPRLPHHLATDLDQAARIIATLVSPS